MMSSPPEFITPPGSERSLSGEGKDTMTAETTSTEQTQKVLHQNIINFQLFHVYTPLSLSLVI